MLGCVTPKATVDPRTHQLARSWIAVYSMPSRQANRMSFMIASPLSRWIAGESGAFYHVMTGNSMQGWPFKPRARLGWVRKTDVQEQGIRNCT